MAITVPKRNPSPSPDDATPARGRSSVLTSRPASGASSNNSSGGGFVLAKPSSSRRLIISLCGEEKTGKDHCAFTAPEPIYVHSFDIGLEGVVDKFLDGTFGKKTIYVADYELSVQPGQGSPQEVAEGAAKVLEKFVSNYRDGLNSCGQGTTVVDTDTELWALVRLARLGRLTQVMPHQYGPVNAEFRDIIREAYNHSGNLFLLGMLADEWENDAQGKGRKTGRKTRKGFSELGFLTQVNAETFREDLEGGGSNFQVIINDCRLNPSVNGMQLPNDYDTIRSVIFGE